MRRVLRAASVMCVDSCQKKVAYHKRYFLLAVVFGHTPIEYPMCLLALAICQFWGIAMDTDNGAERVQGNVQ